MQITTRAWLEYINKMSKISKTAADKMQEYIQKNGFGDDQAILEYAYQLSTFYGEAIGALACEMYDATAIAQGVILPPALPAEPPGFGEVAKAVHGTIKNSSQNQVPATIGRIVKQTGADTTLKNLRRDGGEFAWIPTGAETCAFCIMLASNGWQRISKATLRKGHAEHIHFKCDCNYAVRFDGKSSVEGYNPEDYADQFIGAEGLTWMDKVNTLRRQIYKNNKE